MARNWTEGQKSVIHHAGGDLTVSAAAGSGKTTVMVERVLRLVTQDRIDLSRLLLVTFTRAAAGEMRQRIAESLEEALNRNPGDRFLRRQHQSLPDAPIGTLHHFCVELLRQYGASIGLDPDYVLCDETRSAALWDESVEEALRESYAAGGEGFALLARGWSSYANDGLQDLCRQLRSIYSSSPMGVGWVRDRAQEYERTAQDPIHSPMGEILFRESREALKDCAEKVARMQELLAFEGAPKGYAPCIEQDGAWVERLLACSDLTELSEMLSGVTFASLKGRKKTDDPETVDEIKSLREKVKKILTDEKKTLDRTLGFRNAAEDAQYMVPAMYALAELMESCERIFSEKKRLHSYLDFNDLEHKALELVQLGDVREEVRNLYDYVFVDEYQDTNAVQEQILMNVVKPGRFFCVGDAKQAIYRFRQADPTLFLERYQRSSPDENAPMRRIDLSNNYRSHPSILHFVNAVCERVMSPELGGMVYDEAARLVPGLDHPEKDACVLHADLVMKPEEPTEENEEDELEELSGLEQQSLVAAQRILERMGRPIRDHGTYRPARFRDFVILMEAVSGKGQTVADTLRACGIPCVVQQDGNWTQQGETALMLSALSYLDNSDRAAELMTLLHSPFGGFSLDELLWIRRRYPKTEFPAAVRQCADEDTELSLRLATFLAEWDDLRRRAMYMDVESLIWEIAGMRAWYTILAAQPGGQEAQKRIRLLAQQARNLSQSRENSLYAFLTFVKSMKTGDDAAGTGVGDEDAVWITTIHKSKGLEFPVVILLNAGKKFRLDANVSSLSLHDRFGLGPACFLTESHLKYETLPQRAITLQNRSEARSEKLRLLYVALTRPREELYIIAHLGSHGAKRMERWCAEESTYEMRKADSMIDWIGPILMRHPCTGDTGVAKKPYPFALEVNINPEIRRQRWTYGAAAEEESQPEESYLDGFAYRYPYASSVSLPGKLSVTSLLSGYTTKHGEEPEAHLIQKEPSYDPRRAGTLTHGVLQYLQYGMDEAQIRRRIDQLCEAGVIAREDAKMIRVGELARFCAGDVARRAVVSPRVLREQPFNLLLPARELYPEKEECGDRVMIQGVLDLAFLEEGRWILIDYKTNRIPEEGSGALLEHYRVQLRLYKRALEDITGIPVAQAGLSLLSNGETVWMEEEE